MHLVFVRVVKFGVIISPIFKTFLTAVLDFWVFITVIGYHFNVLTVHTLFQIFNLAQNKTPLTCIYSKLDLII